MHKKLPNLIQILLICAASAAWAFAVQGDAAKKPGAESDESLLVGDWRGDSICVVRESPCHDEDSLYHFTKMPGKPGWFSLKADKIVGGHPETMGTLECKYDGKARTLECAVSDRAVLQFTWEGKEMRGTMTLTDKTLWRKIALKKVGALRGCVRSASELPWASNLA
jgi:hypothetical protein